jgi:hypothetical protein
MQKGVTQALRFGLPNFVFFPTPLSHDTGAIRDANLRRSKNQQVALGDEIIALLRSPTASQGQGGALGEAEARKRGNTVGIRDQAMDLAKLQGHKVSREVDNLLPTPNTMEHREVKTPEQIAALKAKSPGGYRNLRETVINELFPTPITSDYKNGKSSAGYGLNLPETAKSLMPTPKALDGVKGNLKTSQERIDSGRQVDLPNVAIDLIGTPRANAANSSSKQVEAGAPKSRIEDQVLTTNWGKFEPAIRRWEAVIGRQAPEPTKPDGKDGNHRLSSKFTEWMMGLPDGWITGHDLKRNDELKLAGNGVVPQQAELALRLLLDLPEAVNQ